MSACTRRLFTALGLLLSPSAAMAQNYQNVVIGEGCASICVDGVCEKTCRGQKASKSSARGDGIRGASNEGSKIVSESFDATDFSVVIVKGVNTDVVFSDGYDVTVEGSEPCLATLELELNAGLDNANSLKISSAVACAHETKVQVTMPRLDTLRVYGNSNATVSGFEQNSLNIEAYDNTDLQLLGNTLSSANLVAEGNSTVNSTKSHIFNADVALSGRSDVTLRLGRKLETGYLTGIVAGMSDLLFCGATAKSLKINELADANEVGCEQLNRNLTRNQ